MITIVGGCRGGCVPIGIRARVLSRRSRLWSVVQNRRRSLSGYPPNPSSSSHYEGMLCQPAAEEGRDDVNVWLEESNVAACVTTPRFRIEWPLPQQEADNDGNSKESKDSRGAASITNKTSASNETSNDDGDDAIDDDTTTDYTGEEPAVITAIRTITAHRITTAAADGTRETTKYSLSGGPAYLRPLSTASTDTTTAVQDRRAAWQAFTEFERARMRAARKRNKEPVAGAAPRPTWRLGTSTTPSPSARPKQQHQQQRRPLRVFVPSSVNAPPSVSLLTTAQDSSQACR